MELVTTDIEVDLQEPSAAESFETLGLSEGVLRAVSDAGYRIPTPIQREAIPLILRGRDVIGLAQTGTGKTAAFTLPLVDLLIDGPRRTRAVVLTPTRELCMQVEQSIQKYARHSQLSVAAVFGGVPLEPQEKALRQGVDVVVATPVPFRARITHAAAAELQLARGVRVGVLVKAAAFRLDGGQQA